MKILNLCDDILGMIEQEVKAGNLSDEVLRVFSHSRLNQMALIQRVFHQVMRID